MDYLRSARLARRMITKNGTKAVLRIPTGQSVWDDNNAEWIDEYKEYQGVCLVTSYEQEDIDGSLIKAGDSKLLCVFPVEPEPNISLVDVYKKNGVLGATYHAITISPLAPDSTTVILFKIQGRM
jgi:hypothetical protein